MSFDFQFISVVDDLQVVFHETVEGSDPRTLRVVGKSGFSSAQRILLNDYGQDTFELYQVAERDGSSHATAIEGEHAFRARPGESFSQRHSLSLRFRARRDR